ncbi:Thioredoxin reductase [Williamsia sterculiae]|uniref:Thioredoxin reductase n=1 Tax=Williamsia sterculiae TaxID=1344003 RepID=A0A1N7HAC0_9NOCA|nr:Thioredoxin reductase [Williamsia sterculiae]
MDVVVIGGGAAGLSAAITLGRSLRSVVVIDAGSPRNAPADGVHNFLTRDGMPPGELVDVGREELARYGGRFVTGKAVSAAVTDDGFTVRLASGEQISARRIIDATGLTDELPDVTGVRERWGRDVMHCPYCHGWEVRGRRLVILGSGPMSGHQALLLRQWSDDITYLVNTAPTPTPEQREQLAARDIRVVEGAATELVVAPDATGGDAITGVRLDDGTVVDCEIVVVGPRMVARSAVLDALGVGRADHPLGPAVADVYAADPMGRTDVLGVWVAGNARNAQGGVINAAAEGFTAASMLNMDLVLEETEAAVRQRRSATPARCTS